LAAAKSVILMIMIASLASGILGVLLALFVGGGPMLVISIPGFVVGAFFAFKYARYDKSKAKEEEHRRSRNRHKH
jgi:uncharacterized membrane protein YoaK (UPF0700 family)